MRVWPCSAAASVAPALPRARTAPPSSPSLRAAHTASRPSSDPFADTGEDALQAVDAAAAEQKAAAAAAKQKQGGAIHIRIQQRNGRKTLTTLQGLPKGECASCGDRSGRARAGRCGRWGTGLCACLSKRQQHSGA